MVRFADKLESNRVIEWSQYYVDYNGLKKLLKTIERKLRALEALPDNKSDAGDERTGSQTLYGAVIDSVVDRFVNTPDPDEEFFIKLQLEAEKVEDFYLAKVQELSERLNHARESVKRLKEKLFLHDDVSASPALRSKFTKHDLFEATDKVDSATSAIRRQSSLAMSQIESRPTSESININVLDTPQKKESAKGLGGGDHSDSDEENNFGPDFLANASLKRSFVDIYRQMNFLLSFTSLNYTSFVKILKKHDKMTKRNGTKRGLQMVQNYYFYNANSLKELIDELERLFAAAFHNRNLIVARNDLLVKNRPLDSFLLFHLGFECGVVVTLLFWVIWVIAIDAYTKPEALQISASVFIVYRGLSTLILSLWLWAYCVYFWDSYRVNFIFLFEFDPRDVSNWYNIVQRAANLTIIYLLNMLAFIKTARGEFFIESSYASVFPAIMFTFSILYAFYTHLGPAGSSLTRIVLAPFAQVSFFDSFVADIMTSLVRAFVDIAFSLCFFLSGEWRDMESLHAKDSTQSYCMNAHWYQNSIVPIVICIPLWFRFAQCLRRYYDTRKRNMLVNAAKYVLALSVVVFGVFHQISSSESYHQAWFFSAFLSSFCTFIWDVRMDWGLLKNQNYFLRERLMYPKWTYVCAIVLDLGLRFLWTLTLIPSVAEFFSGGAAIGVANSDYSPLSMYMTALLGWAEACRRCMWAFFRVEHEHLVNAFGFRRVDFVPLHFDAPLDQENGKKPTVSKLGLFIELSIFFVVIATMSILAVV